MFSLKCGSGKHQQKHQQSKMLRDAVIDHKLFTKTRLPSLYSDFRKLQDFNPDGYDANLVAWRSLFTELFTECKLKHTFALETAGLQDELILAGQGKPMCVDLVLEDLVRTGDLIPWSRWVQSEGIYETKWVKPVINWALNRFIWDTRYKLGAKHGLKDDTLVSKLMLEKYVGSLFKVLSTKRHELVFKKDQFRKLLETADIIVNGYKPHLSDLDFEILLTYLDRDVGRIYIRDEVIKFDEEITDVDVGICEIKTTIEALEDKNKELQTKIDATNVRLKQSLNNKSNKELSLNLLRSKKVAERSLSKQLNSLTQLESVLYKIDESSSNLQMLSALEKGSVVLKSLNAQSGGVERVEEIMDELEEDKYQADQITEQFQRLGPVNNSEVEEELQMLEEEEETKAKSNVDEISKKLEELDIAPEEITEKKEAELLHG